MVSHKAGKELHFGMSYPDQFGRIHVEEIDDIEVDEIMAFDKTWKQQAHLIKENKKPEPVTLYRHGNYIKQGNGQATLFGEQQTDEHNGQTTKQERYDEHIDMLSYNALPFDESDDELMSWEAWDKYDDLMLDYEKGRIKKKKFKRELKKLGVDENGFPIPT